MKSVVDSYMEQVQKHKVHTREEELELARRYRKGDKKAGDKLVVGYLRFAAKIAHQYRGYNQPLEDLMQEANMGLVKALEHYDPERGFRFMSYATWWVHSCLKQYVMKNHSLVKFGTNTAERSAFGTIRRRYNEIKHQDPTLEDAEIFALLADEMNTTPEAADSLYQRLTRSDASLNAQVAPGARLNYQDLLESNEPTPLESLEMAEREELLRDAIETVLKQLVWDAETKNEQIELESRHRKLERLRIAVERTMRDTYVVSRRLLSEDPMTLQEIGEKFGTSRERARQIESAILKRLTTALGANAA